jgi:ribosomal protein S18 acetylase RimI-like enzyme
MITIRQLESKDREVYKALRLEALERYPRAFGETPREWEAVTLEEVEGRIQKALQSQYRALIGAFDEEALVGMLLLDRPEREKTRHKAYIYSVYVTPAYHKQGIGKKLIAAAIEIAYQMEGLERLVLYVESENQVAIHLYQACGFQIIGVEPQAMKYQGQAIDMAMMVLELPIIQE